MTRSRYAAGSVSFSSLWRRSPVICSSGGWGAKKGDHLGRLRARQQNDSARAPVIQFAVEVHDRLVAHGEGLLLIEEGVFGHIDLDTGLGGQGFLDRGNDLLDRLKESGGTGGVKTDDFNPFCNFGYCRFD